MFIDTGRCNPQQFTKQPHPTTNTSYFYCNADGTLAKRDCPQGKVFNGRRMDCELPKGEKEAAAAVSSQPARDSIDAILSQPQHQAPDDICAGGVPLTRLSAPVVCNPAISSCPDGYFCTLHGRTGTSYCCQALVEPIQETTLCTGNQVTFFEPLTSMPKSCSMSSPSSCPTGFGCNMVSGSFTRCCGRDFGCPMNSAGYVNPSSASHVQCNAADSHSCPHGICLNGLDSTVCKGDSPKYSHFSKL